METPFSVVAECEFTIFTVKQISASGQIYTKIRVTTGVQYTVPVPYFGNLQVHFYVFKNIALVYIFRWFR